MRHLNVTQGSLAWFEARAGKPTASCFDRILTPATLKRSKQSEAYMNRLLAEKWTGQVFEEVTTVWMEQGKSREAEACQYYEFQTGRALQACGFCLTDDGKIGASPDRFAGDEGIAEIKCPLPSTHIGYLLDGEVPVEYWLQVQGELFVTGRAWCDFLSYCPGLPELLVRVEPDLKTQSALALALGDFLDDFAAAWERLCALTDGPPRRLVDPATDDQLEAVLAAGPRRKG